LAALNLSKTAKAARANLAAAQAFPGESRGMLETSHRVMWILERERPKKTTPGGQGALPH
jgi:hypothetical protein